jgi:hypothetical protein
MTIKLLTYTPAIECYECGQKELIRKSFLLVGEYYFCCKDCRDKQYFKCSNCEDYYQHDDGKQEHETETYCQDCFDDLFFYCDGCNEIFIKDDDEEHLINDEILCESCFTNKYYLCIECNTPLRKHHDTYFEVNGDIYCQDCFDDNCTFCCDCGDSTRNEDIVVIQDESYCSSCADKHRTSKQHANTFEKTFGIKTCYGIEIECCSEDEMDFRIDHVELDTDGSITPDEEDDKSNELRLGILQGDAGIDTLKTVCTRLTRYNAYVNKTTGLHIHVDATSISDSKLDCLKSMAWVFDKVIFGLMPMSRRQNTYCRCLPVPFRTIKDQFRNPGDRYHGFNLESLDKHSTIEFRYHSGTTNFLKIYHWLTFCLHFVQYGQDFFWTCNQFRPGIGRLRLLCQHINLPKDTMLYLIDRYRKFNNGTDDEPEIAIEERQFQEVA